MQPASGGLTRTQVGIDVCTAESVDRLLRVANQEQAGFRTIVFDAIDAFEDSILHRVGVLKLIDQRDRELLANQRRKTFASVGLQSGIQAQQHVVEAHLGATPLLFFKARAYPFGGMLQHCGIRGWQCIEARLELWHRVQAGVTGSLAFPRFGHPVGSQSGETGADIQLLQGLIFGPCLELFEPRFEVTRLHLATVDSFARNTLMTDGEQFVCPLTPWHFQLDQRGTAFLQTFIDQLRRRLALVAVTLTGEQAAHARQQRCGPAPVAANPIQGIALHRVTEQPPVIAQHFAEQLAVVSFQRLGKQAATVERMLTQHALTPTVDRRDSCLVHPLRGDIEAVGATGPLWGVELITQFGDQRVGRRRFVTKESSGLSQTRAYALPQFLGRGIGEGHHQNLWWQQFSAESTRLVTMPEDKPQIQSRNGKGLAGPGTGFDQLAAL
ncbi:hypothetical protein D3C81_887680 [compost metagenome]